MSAKIFAVLAGILFGFWPMLTNKSGLRGDASAMMITAFAALVVLPVALLRGAPKQILVTPTFYWAALGGVLAGVGMLLFNETAARATPREMGMVFLLMLIAQMAVPVIWDLILTGDYQPKKIAGIILAFVVAYLLS